MSSVIKNPMILNSANYIYNWFTAINHKNNNLIKNSNMLEAVESDEIILNNLKRNKTDKEMYEAVEDRLNKITEKLNND